MKRKTMLDEMTAEIYSFSAAYPQYPLNRLNELANIILSKQEELGMKPPPYFTKESGWLNGWEKDLIEIIAEDIEGLINSTLETREQDINGLAHNIIATLEEKYNIKIKH